MHPDHGATASRDLLTVFGSINIDIAATVAHLPSPGETILGGDPLISPGGKGANQAHAGRRFGARTRLVGCIGDDAFAAPALAALRAAGVDLGGVRGAHGSATGTACITVDAIGENTIVVAPGANALLRAEQVSDVQLTQSGFLLLQMEAPFAESMALARRARAMGCRVMLNAAPMTCTALPADAIDWLVVNRIELQQLCDSLLLTDAETDPVAQAVRLARHFGLDVALTLGSDGAVIVGRDGRHSACAALSVPVVDTTGAGDTFAGVLAAALMERHAEPDALRYAVAAAGLACTHVGAQAAQPDRRAIDAAFDTLNPATCPLNVAPTSPIPNHGF